MVEVMIPAGKDGAFSAYLSLPNTGTEKRPGIVMMQQIFGVNPEMRSFTDAYAAQGYVAICPDLFWRLEPGVQLLPGNRETFPRALDLISRLDHDRAVEDLQRTVAFLRAHPSCNGKIATIGYCLGGLLAYLMAICSDADAHIGYFGVGIENHLDEAAGLKKPLLLHIPEEDSQVPREGQVRIRDRLHDRAELHFYPGADHAFNRVGAKTYDAAVTALADERTNDFLRLHVGA